MLQIKRLHPEARLPVRATEGSVGLDLYALLMTESGRTNNLLIPPRMQRAVPTGLAIKPPDGFATFVCSRSGMARQCLFVINAPGVIDPDYRGELVVLLYNGGLEAHYVRHGDRIGQLILWPCPIMPFEEVEKLDETTRGTAGLGSTGR